MKEKVTKFYTGGFTYNRPKLILSETDIVFSVCAGSIYSGVFTISNDKNTNIKGILESSCPFLKLKAKEFSDTLAKIEFIFDASNLEPNVIFNEDVKVISDCGEYKVNINAHIVKPYFNSNIGKISDLTRFTYLARYQYDHAVKIFTSKEFPSYILSKDDNYAFIRKHLLKSRSMNQALDEFLNATKQKLPINLSISQTKLNYEMGNESIADKVLVTMENWGFIDIEISSDSPFIYIEKKYITSDLFVGKSYFMEFIILPKNMHQGNNYGRIYIKTIYETLIIEIKAKLKSRGHINNGNKRKEEKTVQIEEKTPLLDDNSDNKYVIKAHKINLTKHYLDFKLKNITIDTYIKSVNEILNDIKYRTSKARDSLDSDYATLLLIQLSTLEEDDKTGRKLLNKIEARADQWKKEKNKLYWSYMSLKYLYSGKKESDYIIKQIEKYYYGEGRYNSELLWQLICISPDIAEDKRKILKEIKIHFDAGARSPYLYLEALKIFNETPSYLRELGQFEIQIINFAIKINHMSKSLVNQFVYLTSKEKKYNQLIFRALGLIYEETESSDVLNAICSLLIKGNKRGNKFFSWYNLGVRGNLRIAELYEFFMHSLDESKSQVIPQNLLYYFLYSNTLNVTETSYLYAYIVENKYKLKEIYESYLPKIERFAYEQIKLESINRHLANVYLDIFYNSNLLKDRKKLLWNIIFRYEIICDNPNIKGVLVAYPEIEKDFYVPLNKGQVQIDLYNDNSEMFFVDSNDNLYYDEINHSKSHLIDIEENMIDHLPQNKENTTWLINTANKVLENEKYDKDSIEVRKQILKFNATSRELYNKHLISIIDYYRNANPSLLDNYLEMLEYLPISLYNKSSIIELLIDRKFYERAFEEIKRFGFCQIDGNRLLELCTHFLKTDIKDKEEVGEILLQLSYHCFQQEKYNEYILNNLIKNYYGYCQDLYGIWEKSLNSNIDTRDIEAKILTGLIFTESKEVDSFKVYKNFTKDGINSTLAKSFLNYQAYEYLVREYSINKEYFKSMKSLIKTEKNDYLILALLKSYSEQETLNEEQTKFVYRFLDEYIKKDWILPFFKKFKEFMKFPYDFINKIFVEIKTDLNNKVTIKYRIFDLEEGQENNCYSTEVMDHIIAGIFTKSFLIFYKEKLEYSITVEQPDGTSFKVKEETLELGQDMELNEENLYNQINFMKLAIDTDDGEAFIDSYNKVCKMDYVINKAFKPI